MTTRQNANNRGQQRTVLLTVSLLFVCALGIELGAQAHLPSAEDSTIATANYSVEIKGLKFLPPVVTVHPGDKVQWTNNDFVPHTATTVDKGFDSGSIGVGETWTLTAPAKKGDYFYICTFHPNMKAKLVVQ